MEQASHTKVLSAALELLEPLDTDTRRRVIETMLTFFGEDMRKSTPSSTWEPLDAIRIPRSQPQPIPFSDRTDITSKDFLLQKSPKSDVERVACLAFYLTQFRGVSHFKTADLTKLNTEAAQPRFSNAAQAVANATKYGYLAPATKGNKQISAQGEQFVIALPDREAARSAMAGRPKRAKSRAKLAKPRPERSMVLTEMHGRAIPSGKQRRA